METETRNCTSKAGDCKASEISSIYDRSDDRRRPVILRLPSPNVAPTGKTSLSSPLPHFVNDLPCLRTWSECADQMLKSLEPSEKFTIAQQTSSAEGVHGFIKMRFKDYQNYMEHQVITSLSLPCVYSDN